MKKAYKIRQTGTGNSLQVVIPALWVQHHNLKSGDLVVVDMQNDCLIIRPFETKSEALCD